MSPDRVAGCPRRPARVLLVLATAVALLVGGVSAAPRASAAVGVPRTYLDQTYSSSVTRPSADKPQSKLWFLDGSWWALMVEAGGTATYIHQLMPDHTWRRTGALVDSRANSSGDALMSRDGKLWVVSRVSSGNLLVDRFTYNAAGDSWAIDAGFPTSVPSGGSESATIDQDSLGRFWVTWTRGARVYVAHSTDSSGATWTAPFQPAVADTVISADDLSGIIAFGSSVGVLYSDQQSGGFHFAIHDDADPDTAWRSENINSLPNMADDHINLKQLVGDPQGRIFAAIKTSANDSPTARPGDPLVGVLTRTPNASGVGTWTFAVAGTVGDDHTRPIIMIDATNQQLYFFGTAPQSGGDVFYKKTPLSSIAFGPGRGTPFVDAGPVVNNASGSKDPVTAATGMVILAVAEGQKRYVHAEMALAPGGTFDGGGGTTDPAPTVTARNPAANATGVAAATDVTATFSEPVQGVDATSFRLTDAAGATVPAAVTLDAAGTTGTLDPSADLAAGARYTATLVGGASAIRDATAHPLATTTWTFTTTTTGGGTGGDGTPPTVTARTPAAGATAVGVGTNITATFSEAVQGVDPGTFTVRSAAGAVVSGVLTSSGNRWILNPGSALARDTRYTVTLTGGTGAIRDASGTPLSTVTWDFVTGPAPRVSARTPAVNATGVSRTANVTATFSEPVQGVDGTTFTLTTAATGAPVAATVRAGSGNRWILDPGATLAAGTRYTVRITGGATAVRDAAGNPLPTTTWSFTTGA